MLKAWLYFSVGSQHYGNSAATRMLAIMIKHKMSPYSSENYKGDFLERLVLQKSTLAALSGDVPAKMFLANLYGNTEKTCFKGVDILKNVSRQLIEEEYLSRIFVKHGVYLQEQHFFRKRFAQVQPSSEEV